MVTPPSLPSVPVLQTGLMWMKTSLLTSRINQYAYDCICVCMYVYAWGCMGVCGHVRVQKLIHPEVKGSQGVWPRKVWLNLRPNVRSRNAVCPKSLAPNTGWNGMSKVSLRLFGIDARSKLMVARNNPSQRQRKPSLPNLRTVRMAEGSTLSGWSRICASSVQNLNTNLLHRYMRFNHMFAWMLGEYTMRWWSVHGMELSCQQQHEFASDMTG